MVASGVFMSVGLNECLAFILALSEMSKGRFQESGAD
jgi:hypothetical protein